MVRVSIPNLALAGFAAFALTIPLLPGSAATAAVRRGAHASTSKTVRSQAASRPLVGKPRLASRSGRQGLRSRRSTPRRIRSIPWMKGNLPNVQAHGAYVLDLANGQELFTRRADEPRPIASISKLAAALTVVDRGLDLDATTTIIRADIDVARGGARSRLQEGMTLTNRDLLHAALLGSDNRAVPALGRAVGYDAAGLATAMTKKVGELGLKHTRFVEPTGLSPENVSTPRELIDLLRAVMDHPVLGEITKRLEYDVRPIGRAQLLRYSNTHRMASRPNTLVLGGKTGFNNAARYCLVLAARVGGRTIGMVFLGNEGELTRFGDVARVADWVQVHEGRAVPRETVIAAAPPSARTTVALPARPTPLTADRLMPTLPRLPETLPPSFDSPGATVPLAPPALVGEAIPVGTPPGGAPPD